ncbi:hypothetical protein ABR737_00260 [Streptomyces sp. Edi2]|uniref:hypothetical protein n=1 Tax=Streptomyces sp. Edi2 TaxID=3162528 RepID=UPI003305DC80
MVLDEEEVGQLAAAVLLRRLGLAPAAGPRPNWPAAPRDAPSRARAVARTGFWLGTVLDVRPVPRTPC